MHRVARRSMNLFRPSANSFYWSAIAGIGVIVLGAPLAAIVWARTPYATGAEEPVQQPVKFDHRHHVRDDGIQCLYCHAGADRAPYAGVPATSVCMGCHDQVWTDSPEVAPVRESAFSGKPLRWMRVTMVPDFVFFDHAIHVRSGVECVSCHGRVDEMAQVYAVAPFTMRWCLDCHRTPGKHLPQDVAARVRPSDDCTACHR